MYGGISSIRIGPVLHHQMACDFNESIVSWLARIPSNLLLRTPISVWRFQTEQRFGKGGKLRILVGLQSRLLVPRRKISGQNEKGNSGRQKRRQRGKITWTILLRNKLSNISSKTPGLYSSCEPLLSGLI